MRRAVITLAATGAGLALVLGFRPGAAPQTIAPVGTVAPVTTVAGTAGTKVATGTDQPIGSYGDIQVRVTSSGGRITKVDLARLNVTGPSSQQIVNNVIPQLQQQTIAAQSVNINGVSGATYTVRAYKQSLQSALDQLAAQGGVSAQAAQSNGNTGGGQGGGEHDD
jgi:uncharacterized protein with FMN-binding domain